MATTAVAAPDLTSPRFKADPYPFYARLRAEAPVCPVRLPDKRTAWLVTRYDDVLDVLKDGRIAKDPLTRSSRGSARTRPGSPGCSSR